MNPRARGRGLLARGAGVSGEGRLPFCSREAGLGCSRWVRGNSVHMLREGSATAIYGAQQN